MVRISAPTARVQQARKNSKVMAWQKLRTSVASAMAKDQVSAPSTMDSEMLRVRRQNMPTTSAKAVSGSNPPSSMPPSLTAATAAGNPELGHRFPVMAIGPNGLH